MAIRVLMLCHVIPPAYGGAGRQAFALGAELTKQGNSVAVVGARVRESKRHEDIEGVCVRRLGLPWPGRLGRLSFYASLIFYLPLVLPRVDVLHMHGVFWSSVAGQAYASLFRVPTVLKMTRMGDDDARTLCSRVREGELASLRAWPLKAADSLIALNTEMLDGCEESGLGDRAELLPNAVDCRRFTPASADEREMLRARHRLDRTTVLFTGGLLEHKGLKHLLGALERPLTQPVTVLVVGPNDRENPEVDPELGARVKELSSRAIGLVDVRMMGLVSGDEMLELYKAADVYVLPTEREGNPNALMEAMACGVACIASKVPGVIDAGIPVDAFRGVTYGDVEELRKALVETQADSVARRRMGSIACSFVARDRSLGSLARTYSGLYSVLIAKRRRGHAERFGQRG